MRNALATLSPRPQSIADRLDDTVTYRHQLRPTRDGRLIFARLLESMGCRHMNRAEARAIKFADRRKANGRGFRRHNVHSFARSYA